MPPDRRAVVSSQNTESSGTRVGGGGSQLEQGGCRWAQGAEIILSIRIKIRNNRGQATGRWCGLTQNYIRVGLKSRGRPGLPIRLWVWSRARKLSHSKHSPKCGPEEGAKLGLRGVKARDLAVSPAAREGLSAWGPRCDDGDPPVGGDGAARTGWSPPGAVTWIEACRPCHELV